MPRRKKTAEEKIISKIIDTGKVDKYDNKVYASDINVDDEVADGFHAVTDSGEYIQ